MNVFKTIWARLTSSGKYLFGPRRAFWMRANTAVDEDSSMQVAAFNRGIIYISSQIAKLPWDIKDENNNVQKNQTSNLLNLAPNDEINSFIWRLWHVQQAIIHGNSFSEIERDNIGRVIALWPLESCRMRMLRSDSGKLVYVYEDPHNGTIFLQPRDVYHLRNFHVKEGGLVGQGVVSYGREVLGIQIAADSMASGLFHNSGIPSGVLEHPGKLSDEAYKRLKESWDEQQGGKKTGSTALLEEGLKYNPINLAPDVLQFLESRKFGILEIARFLGVPPTKLFDVTAATYSNVEQSNLEVATDTLDTWATNLEMEADVKILNYRFGGRYTDIDLYSIFRGDMKTRSDYFKAMQAAGAMTANQIRAREGLPGYGPNGDLYFISTNNLTPVNRMNEVIDAEITQKTKPTTAPVKENNTSKAVEAALINALTK